MTINYKKMSEEIEHFGMNLYRMRKEIEQNNEQSLVTEVMATAEWLLDSISNELELKADRPF